MRSDEVRVDELLVERLARAYHERYRAAGAQAAASTGPRVPWEALPEPLREANRASARAIPEHLTAMGLRVRRPPPGRPPTSRPLGEAQVEAGARREHDRWVAHTRDRGYVAGPVRDDAAEPPTHPDLVPWEELDEPARDKDRMRIRAIPDLLAEVGLELGPINEHEPDEGEA